MTTHCNGEERGICARGVAEEEILGGAMGRVEGGPDVGDSGNTFVMDSLSRRTLVTALGIGDRTQSSKETGVRGRFPTKN